MPKVLIIGSDGQLGSAFHEQIQEIYWATFSFSTIENLDLTQPADIQTFFSDKKFDFILNCAAYTAVDKAETEKELAFKLNAEAPKLIAREANKTGTRVIHISTDYVFGGNHCRPLKPDGPKAPESVYGQSKLKGEEELMKANPESMIIRTAWLYSRFGNNFLKTMLRLGKEKEYLNVVYDQIGSPTLADDLAGAIISILEKIINGKKQFVPGIYHFSNEGVCSWFDFATSIFDKTGIHCPVFPVESDQFPTPAPRPFYSVMDKALIKETYGIKIPHWQASLTKCLDKMTKI
ncbi:dTDP-4-dehydrorhamnose reductase [Marinilabilia rubra]|uniref:dTDP-4-dehydrorhamnose reductase n=1 Tax=Marinilabilia rubra TaxID=2162893 RepID=A0A2U2B6K8_9BACT|nr:dTDP-4-dehydrorhamnose reductase [Marinilabilia rubra]PWD98697.1 dTDP-4-dehydrorhamnose reductase [Marinilabilia rubra]